MSSSCSAVHVQRLFRWEYSDSLGPYKTCTRGRTKKQGFRPLELPPLSRLKFEKRIKIRPISLQSTAPAQGLKWYMTASIAKLTSYPLYFPHHHWSSGRSRRIHPWQLLQETRQMMITVQVEIGGKKSRGQLCRDSPPWQDLAFAAATSQVENSNPVFYCGSFLRIFEASRRALFFYQCARKRRIGAWGIHTRVLVTIDPFLHTVPRGLTQIHLFRAALAGCRHWLEKSLAPLLKRLSMLNPRGLSKNR